MFSVFQITTCFHEFLQKNRGKKNGLAGELQDKPRVNVLRKVSVGLERSLAFF